MSASDPSRSPLALWHLLSLDAPTVAAVWTVFVGWSAGVRLSPVDPLAMFVAVWMLYAADRLLDARPLAAGLHPNDLEDRHRFHHRYRRRFLPLIVAATIPLAFLVHRLAPPVLHLYALLASLLAGWLLLVHGEPAPSFGDRRLPKELAVGLFFPAAVFIPSVARAPSLRAALLPAALLFAGVCTLNCLFLYAWEHPRDRSHAHATTRWSLRRLRSLASLLLTGAVALTVLSAVAHRAHRASFAATPHAWALPSGCLASTALLLLLEYRRPHLKPLHLRALADLALLTPLVLMLIGYAGLLR